MRDPNVYDERGVERCFTVERMASPPNKDNWTIQVRDRNTNLATNMITINCASCATTHNFMNSYAVSMDCEIDLGFKPSRNPFLCLSRFPYAAAAILIL